MEQFIKNVNWTLLQNDIIIIGTVLITIGGILYYIHKFDIEDGIPNTPISKLAVRSKIFLLYITVSNVILRLFLRMGGRSRNRSSYGGGRSSGGGSRR